MKVVLHIGTPKTGTTTIQRFLRLNQDALKVHDILILPKEEAGRNLSIELLCKFRAGRQESNNWRHLGINDIAEKERFCNKYEAALHKYLSSCGQTSTLVISNEGLGWHTVDEINYLKSIFEPYTSEFKVLGYLRRPDLKALSSYKNLVRNVSQKNKLNFKSSAEDSIGNYSDRFFLNNWDSVFGFNAITLKVFPDSSVVKYDLLTDFVSYLNVPGFVSVPIEDGNSSWDHRCLEFVRLANSLKSGLELKITYDDWTYIVNLIDTISFENKIVYKPTRSSAISFYNGKRVDLQELSDKWFPEQEYMFHEDFSMYPEVESDVENKDLVLVALKLVLSTLEIEKEKRRFTFFIRRICSGIKQRIISKM